jgi:hypothetical protein
MDAKSRAFLVRPHQPRIIRHIGDEDCGKTPGLARIAFAGRELQIWECLMRLYRRFGLVSF